MSVDQRVRCESSCKAYMHDGACARIRFPALAGPLARLVAAGERIASHLTQPLIQRKPRSSWFMEAQEAEMSVLGGVMLDNKAFHRVRWLEPPDFISPHHRVIWSTYRSLMADGHPVDPVTLMQRLEQTGRIEEAGGLGVVLGLTDWAATAVNIEHHAQMMRRARRAREMIEAARAYADWGLREGFESVEVATVEARGLIRTLADLTAPGSADDARGIGGEAPGGVLSNTPPATHAPTPTPQQSRGVAS
jgi:hypothetical protein